jgi:N-acetylmuramoyl-L-alanine amidase
LKKKIPSLALWLGIFFLVLAPSGRCAEAPLVWLDPGHGGTDRGVRAPGFEEAAFTLALSQELAKQLSVQGVRVSLSRQDDSGVSLTARVLQANQAHPAAALSLHANDSFGRAQGPRVFIPAAVSGKPVMAGGVPVSRWDQAQGQHQAQSKQLAVDLATALGLTPGHGIQPLPLAIFKGMTAPVVLVECRFASDKDDLAQLTRPQALHDLASRLAQGILHFLGRRGS